MFTRINQNDPRFAALAEAASTGKQRFDYDAVAFAYNQTAVGEILAFEYEKEKLPTLKGQLEKRGIVASVDYQIKAVEIDGVMNAVITRGSEKATTKVVSKPRGPRGPRKPKGDAAAPAPAADASAPAAEAAPEAAGKGKRGKGE